ncbi:hypothetical protein DQ04_01271150 [Trypanosoma grayi]|uniref:hypothetical protein n=1 Tax=Trypanosoma grayi TaxID=71804 RepID=UPI0004F44CB6|nr:hypothetical protein DQ04_01271150 [Trypanosoma grayi]KEG13015.1 hypothetical protein DQ04_01271150 [Trypanosoma grayi]
MGCGWSSDAQAALARHEFNYMDDMKRDRPETPVAAAVQLDVRNRRGKGKDIIAVATANPTSVSYTDYHGLTVVMANATLGKVNTVCRWADAVLEIREQNGGYFVDPRSDSTSTARWEGSFYGDPAISTVSPESYSSAPNRLNVSMYYTGPVTSSRQFDKSQTSRYFDKSHSSMRHTEKSQASKRLFEKTPTRENLEIEEETLQTEELSGKEETSPTGEESRQITQTPRRHFVE